jgi:long-chain acyl-CoA synthetase
MEADNMSVLALTPSQVSGFKYGASRLPIGSVAPPRLGTWHWVPETFFSMTDIGQAFHDHELLLTGGNGFLGKVVLGLILDRLPDFKHLHILVRPQFSVSAEERFYGETLASPALAAVVDKLVSKRGKGFLRERITIWPGDIGRTNCGLEPAALDKLAGRISVIVNCAGAVEFFPPLDVSFNANVDGVENIVRLAHSLSSKLQHVSTCYVCGVADGLVEEGEPILGFYPHRRGPSDTSFQHVEELRYCRERIRHIYDSDDGASAPARGSEAIAPRGQGPGPPALTRSGLGWKSNAVAQRLSALGKQRAEHWGWVNTYTYAKSLGEQIIAAAPKLDYAIVRPAIVESALRFPFPGWIEGGRTAAPLVLMGLGGLKDWPVRGDIPLEVVPVDLVAAAILVVTAMLLDGRHQPVYQLATADVNPFPLEPLVRLLDSEGRRRGRMNGDHSVARGLLERFVGARRDGPAELVRAEEAHARRVLLRRRINRAENFVKRTRAALQKARLPGEATLAAWSTSLRTLGLQATFREQTLEQYLPFILHNRYIFEAENIRAAYNLLSQKDKQLLPWDPENIDWRDYWINNQIPGIEKWVQPEAVKDWTFRI